MTRGKTRYKPLLQVLLPLAIWKGRVADTYRWRSDRRKYGCGYRLRKKWDLGADNAGKVDGKLWDRGDNFLDYPASFRPAPYSSSVAVTVPVALRTSSAAGEPWALFVLARSCLYSRSGDISTYTDPDFVAGNASTGTKTAPAGEGNIRAVPHLRHPLLISTKLCIKFSKLDVDRLNSRVELFRAQMCQ